LGRYCLGLQKEYQVQAADTYEAIADSELLLVTFRGHSLGRKLFLEQIGTPLGQDRYRISEASFVDACPNPRELERRIKKFLTLIEPKPSPRWLAFFEGLRQRAALLSRQERMVVFTLDPRSQAVKDLFAHPKLRRLIAKAEGNRILVSLENHGKFVKIAREEGFYAD
jgi:hypothetical protein